MSKKTPINKVDAHIGARIRSRRMQLDMSQTALGDKLDLTFQQVQKYEKGINRVGGSRMHQIAHALGVTEAYFYEGLPAEGNGKAATIPDFGAQFMATSDGVALAKVWGAIAAPVRRQLVQLAETMVVP